MSEPLIIHCESCQADIAFDQPYPHHAGFGNQGFLYDESGTSTLVWNSYDPAYIGIVGDQHPWALGPADQTKLESILVPAPSGGRLAFENPARCPRCRHAIRGPMMREISYLCYPGSPRLGDLGLRSVMRDTR